MSKQSKSSNGNMLLLAGLGVGALILFANKGNAQSSTPVTANTASDTDDGIPAVPKILAVNTSDSERPLPTGIVSDEDGMESTATSSETSSQSDPYESFDEGDIGKKQTTTKAIPRLISTRLTAKEKAIIEKGVLSDDLAVKRPDLYKAIYTRKQGKNGNSQKLLQAADAIIQSIQVKSNTTVTAAQKKKRKVSIKLAPNTTAMIMAAAQAAGGGMAPMVALTTMKAMQHANSNVKAGAKKGTVHHRAGSKGAHPQRKASHSSATRHPAAKRRVGAAHPKTVIRKKQ